MSTATVGIIVTGLVAIAGFVASEVRARRAAEEAKTLMQQQYENEHDLRRRDRTFQNLREAYLRVLRWTMLADQQVWALEPLQRGRGFQPPEDLDEAQVQRMINELACRRALSANVVRRVGERAGGVPLFVEEVTRLLLKSFLQIRRPPSSPPLPYSLMARPNRQCPARA